MTKRSYTDPTILSSDITPESVFLNRRSLIKSATFAAVAGPTAISTPASAGQTAEQPLDYAPQGNHPLMSEQTPIEAVTSYNNFYEFGTDKSDPARHAHTMTTDPWRVKVGLSLIHI